MCGLQHSQHEHYIDIVQTVFKFSSGKDVNGFKFAVNSNDVRCLPGPPLVSHRGRVGI